MNINRLRNLFNLQNLVQQVSILVETEIEIERVDLTDENDLSRDDLAEIRDLQGSSSVLTKYMYELHRLTTFVINTEEGFCLRMQRIFFQHSTFLRGIILLGFLISSHQLHQQWDSLQEEQTEKLRNIVKTSVITGVSAGAFSAVGAEKVLEYFRDNLQAKIESIGPQEELLQHLDDLV